jgi:hypothetical protein
VLAITKSKREIIAGGGDLFPALFTSNPEEYCPLEGNLMVHQNALTKRI